MSFRPYVEAGWKLCPIRDGEKRPRGKDWNTPARALSATQAEHATAAGLMHAYSGTAALDLDNVDLTRAYLAERGINLNELLQAPDSVHISSGTINRGKLLYAMPVPLPSKKILSPQKVTLFELRCGTADGESMQDLLPPSPHPSGRAYEWHYSDELTGTWQNLPPIPPALLALWHELLGPRTVAPAPGMPAQHHGTEEAHRVLASLDPDVDYDTWLRLGMALSHDLGEEGWQLWHAWSAKGKKYPGEQQLSTHWNSFKGSANPVTLGSFLRELVSTPDDFDVVDEQEPDLFAEIETERKAEKRAALKLWTLDEIQQRPWPTWHVQDILPRAEINMMYGESGIGKSFVALDMSLAIAQGLPWFEHETNQCDVLWLAAEAFGSMKPRSCAYAKGHDLALSTLSAAPFRVVEAFNLNDDELVTTLIEVIREQPPGLVVVDTLAAASGGANENSGEDMGKILDNCRRIHYATRASVLLIHHSGKNADLGARGWSGIKAAVQGELKVFFDEASGQRVITDTKQRDGAPLGGHGFSLVSVDVGVDEKDRTISSAWVKYNGKVETQEVKGDGGGRAGPRGAAMKLALETAMGVIGVAQDAASVDVVAAIIDTMAPPLEGQRDERGRQARGLLDKLVAERYLTQSGGRVRPVTEDMDDDGSDLV